MARTDVTDPPADAGAALGTGLRPRRMLAPAWDELLLAVELAALAAFAFSRPVLDSFGDTPELFVARRAGTADIVLFGVAIALLPAVAVAAVGTASRALGLRARHVVHLALVGILAGLGAWRMGHDQVGRPQTSFVLVGLVVGALLATLRAWRRTRRPLASFLRVAGVASVVAFLGQFLFVSPVSTVAFGGDGQPSAGAESASAAGKGDLAPMVFVVLDGLPTTSLLDGTGHIDEALYPNLAMLADTATWYRNHTTVAGFTSEAVPAILTGRYPDPERSSVRPDPENLFTLLGDDYDLAVRESVTGLCPERLCSRGPSAGVGTLLGDAMTWWRQGVTSELVDDIVHPYALPGATDSDRYDAADQFITEVDLSPSDRPQLTFLHVVLPHGPWQFTDEGVRYELAGDIATGWHFLGWTGAGTDVARQRHLLQAQAGDRLLGQLLDKLRAAGSYDDALIVVTADHGEAFVRHEPGRLLSEGNLHEIVWTPLLVKAPGQTEGEISDDNVVTVDIVPTVADLLGVEIPWEVDGVPARRVATARDPDVKLFADRQDNLLRAAPGDSFLEIDAPDVFDDVLASDPTPGGSPGPGSDPDALWRLTEHGDLFGAEVSVLALAEPADAAVVVNAPAGYDDIDTDEPLPLEVVAGTELPVGSIVAFALNGTIGALGEVQDHDEPGGKLVHGLIPPRLFVDGANELGAYLVDGPSGDATLRPLDLRSSRP